MQTKAQEKKKTVLVVEDTADNLSLMTSLLKDTYKVKVAVDGEKALSIASSPTPPDLVLLDVMMPGIVKNGMAAAIRPACVERVSRCLLA